VFHRKIYYHDKPLILTNSAAVYRQECPEAAGYRCFQGAFPRNYRLAFQHLDTPDSQGVLLEDLSEDALLEGIHKKYKPIEAAGGVVRNEDGGILLIYRRGKWDLPKGKLDDGEDLPTCAVREVQEETGIKRLVLGDLVSDTYHIYSQFGKDLVKHTAWYAMRGSKSETLQPQAKENILEARWIQPEEIGALMLKSYRAIAEVLRSAGVNVG
jgi:8-oxo-dGTP pyrophosphatase MutT (NUDIX family)